MKPVFSAGVRWYGVMLVPLVAFVACLLGAGCGDSGTDYRQAVLVDGRVDLLADEPFRLPIRQEDGSVKTFVVHRWDLIFLGWTFRGVPEDYGHFSAAAEPGPYDHAMAYLGKDPDGFAYVAEMTTAPAYGLRVEGRAVYSDGQLYLRALGTDDLAQRHESSVRYWQTNYTHGTVRVVAPALRERLVAHQDAMLARIHDDYLRKLPFQSPFAFDVEAYLERNEVCLMDDGYENGAFCAEYWGELYEKVGRVCLRNSRENAQEITDYFLHDPDARYAVIPAWHNPITRTEVNLYQIVLSGVRIVDPPPHVCSVDGHVETGVLSPIKLFGSPDLSDAPVAADGGGGNDLLTQPGISVP